MRITLNLTTYFYPKRWHIVVMYLSASALVLLVSLGNIFLYRQNMTEKNALEGRIQRLQGLLSQRKKDIPPVAPRGKDNREMTKEIQFINGIIQRKSFSWVSLMDHLERAVPKNISISRMQSGFQEKKIKISGQARSLEDLTSFLTNLGSSSYFTNSYLLSQSQGDKEGEDAGSFEIVAEGPFK